MECQKPFWLPPDMSLQFRGLVKCWQFRWLLQSMKATQTLPMGGKHSLYLSFKLASFQWLLACGTFSSNKSLTEEAIFDLTPWKARLLILQVLLHGRMVQEPRTDLVSWELKVFFSTNVVLSVVSFVVPKTVPRITGRTGGSFGPNIILEK